MKIALFLVLFSPMSFAYEYDYEDIDDQYEMVQLEDPYEIQEQVAEENEEEVVEECICSDSY